MREIINSIYNNLETFILSIGYWGIFISCFVIVLESILPVLPLCLFIALNCLILGKYFGIIISYLFTIIGCYLSYFLVGKCFKNHFNKKWRNKKGVNKVMNFIDNSNLSSLTVIMAIPFAPAFLINICAGLSNKIEKKTFIISLFIGKIFMVYFWGFIGTSLKESLTNPVVFIKIFIMLVLAYVISHMINKKLGVK